MACLLWGYGVGEVVISIVMRKSVARRKGRAETTKSTRAAACVIPALPRTYTNKEPWRRLCCRPGQCVSLSGRQWSPSPLLLVTLTIARASKNSPQHNDAQYQEAKSGAAAFTSWTWARKAQALDPSCTSFPSGCSSEPRSSVCSFLLVLFSLGLLTTFLQQPSKRNGTHCVAFCERLVHELPPQGYAA